ncbi:MAG: ATPase, T2SS/T4P/T4SS family [Arenicellales bacterium]|jgi:type II secretory ATPase GspE/PulE/Tfp pilus assembly ATPase PilB-like protein|nr:general secretion pathway protein GspE [Rhodospirillaceae bacterium]MDP6268043.1 ATPase, T2SS/T4P/T4SS family [Arenicellales bacterium]MDP7193374.1 ATPase, T2SS/T4P/T4SS family [Arenicellales bacterium]MDP7489367.1 ATPase, T2SS/T4P/T4SS family [Arenicellales bacterium]MDP7618001.1 ATPase, T2SS/T4P/T4SS family [Arenicellales bacterium]|tara:strand:- start:4772 stop:6535 length:1764 start_codon:yes stop_codon:yes gene_type:complete
MNPQSIPTNSNNDISNPSTVDVRRRLRLGEVLVKEGIISEAQVESALAAQKQSKGKRLGEVLVDMRLVDEVTIVKTLAKRLDLPFVDLNQIKISETALKELPARLMREQNILPIACDTESVTVAFGDPLAMEAIDSVRFSCRKRLVEVVSTPTQIKRFVDRSVSVAESKEDFEDFLRSLGREVDREAAAGEDAAAVRLANKIILDAIRDRASDIHIEPNGDRQELLVRFRVDGECREYRRVPAEYREQLVARLKIMARMNIAERRMPQDGKIRFKLGESEIELRVVTLPTAGENEDVVLRILAGSGAQPLGNMNLSPDYLRAIQNLVESPYGMVLAVGPTGSGKTTTLHAMLGKVNAQEKKVWTIEDPVEITQAGLRQMQVNPQIGLSFASAMRSFLRADPDVIMVGEMRDEETAHMAIEASLTGHLVFSTLHTNNAPETITRLVDMGLEPFSFSDALLAVLAQRLCRRLCDQCKEEYEASEIEKEELSGYLGDGVLSRLGGPGPLKLFHAGGCAECDDTGYRGRLALHELLINNDEIREAIQKKATTAELRLLAEKSGMRTLLQDGAAKCLQGLTDLKQVLAVCSR